MDRTGPAFDEVEIVELHEAFDPPCSPAFGTWRSRPTGGTGTAAPSPSATPSVQTGASLVVTLLHERRREALYGIAILGVGGGRGVAALFDDRG